MTLEAWSLQAAAAERSSDRGGLIRLTSLIDRGMEPLPMRGPENYLGMSYNPNIHGPLKCIPFKVEDATTNLGLVFWDTRLGKMQGVFYGYMIMLLDEAGGPQSDFNWRREGYVRLYVLDPINDELEPEEIQWSPQTLLAAAGQKILVKISTRTSRSGRYKELVIMFPPEQSSPNRTLIVASYEESH
ncbi:hypothetical protein L218DRAFT_989858 [Marasmius fiardii PR-910]|nr:hypothetical protein L218DRAFT_989858 [Marasmius fiardii PR-910]